MKYTILYLLAFATSLLLSLAQGNRVLRGTDDNDEKVLTKFNLDDDTQVEFIEVDDDVILTVSERINEQESRVAKVFQDEKEEDDPIAIFQKLQPNEPVPKALKVAKAKIDKLRKKENPEVPSDQGVPENDDDSAADEDDDEGHRALSYVCPDGDSSTGSRCWWLFRYCEGGSINGKECACYYHITNNYGHMAKDNDMITYVNPFRGSLGVAAYDWVYKNGKYQWKLMTSKWCNTGYTCWVKTWGPDRWRKGETYSASGDGYNFSFYTKKYTPGIHHSAGLCPERNWSW